MISAHKASTTNNLIQVSSYKRSSHFANKVLKNKQKQPKKPLKDAYSGNNKINKGIAISEKYVNDDFSYINNEKQQTEYMTTLFHIRAQMPLYAVIVSKLIHAPAIEKISDIASKTIFRHNALLAGNISAFVVTLVVYAIAKRNGFELSGFEPIAGFLLGWTLGLIIDIVNKFLHRLHSL
jgi:hypothetical protein